MEEHSIANGLHLDGATGDIATKSSTYQTFLQLNLDSNPTELYTQPPTQHLRDGGSLSAIQVYEKNPPPYYTEQHFPPRDVDNNKKSVIELLDSKLVYKSQESTSDQHSVEFNDKLIWCEECGESKSTDCTEHPPVVITDSPPLSLARQTLPPQFAIVPTQDGGQSIVTNRRLRKHTRFGPLVGETVADGETSKAWFKIFSSSDSFTLLDTSNEDTSNWMMFIRPACNASEQNLVAYQHNGYIYFSSKCMIAAGTELKVGFSTSYAALMRVKTLSQMVAVPEAPKKVVFKDGFPCDACDHVFVDFESLDSHVCPNEVTKQETVNKGRRTRNKRKGRPQKLGSAPKAKVASGDKVNNDVSEVKKYSKVDVQTIKCDECDQMFNNMRRLEKHRFVHTGEHPYKCTLPVCHKSFNSKFKLERHSLTHGSREFTCNFCKKNFARKDNLKVHLSIHDSSRKLFTCHYKQCLKVYSSKVSYKAHVAQHKVEEGSLECYICHKLYDNAQTLTMHIKVHAGSYSSKGLMEKKYKCPDCDKRFYVSKDRDRHLLTHTKEKKFECNICQMKFARSDHLKRHQTTVHPNGQKKASKSGKGQSKGEKEELGELSATEFTRSIQQILGDTSLPMEANGVTSGASTDLNVTSGNLQIAPLISNVRPQSDHRVNSNGFLSVLATPSSQSNKQTVSSWSTSTDGSSMRYVISNDSLNQADNNVARYYITGDTIRLPSEGPVTTYLLPTDTSQSTTVNIDTLPRQSSLMMESSHTLPSDSLSNDFTSDGMKMLTGLTPIFLNPDGSTTDTDLIPMVYQTNTQ